MRLILRLVAQPRLSFHVGRTGLSLNRTASRGIDRRIARTVGDAQRQQALRTRGVRMSQRTAVAAGDSDIPLRQRPLRMGELRHPPKAAQLLGETSDTLVEQLAPKTTSDEVHISPSVARARGQRTREAFANL